MDPTGRLVLAKQGVGPEPRRDEGGAVVGTLGADYTDVTTTNGASSADFDARRISLYTDVLGNGMQMSFQIIQSPLRWW